MRHSICEAEEKMTFNQLEAFVRLADNGSFSKTASEMYMTQPATSITINRLEDELGLKLFVRGFHSVKLTEDGRRIYGSACRILKEYHTLKDMAGLLSGAPGRQDVIF